MKLNSDCINCLIGRQMSNIEKYSNEELKTDYMRNVLRIIADFDKKCTAPVILEELNVLFYKTFGETISFEKVKNEYNQLMLSMEKDMEDKIFSSPDPLKTALKYSLTANYIDFGAVKNVSRNTLFELFDSALDFKLDEGTYNSFCNDLENGKSLVFLHDNCGEVVLDKILIKVIKKSYPEIKISSVVRGEAVLNDVTLKDSESVGLTDLVPVFGNGTAIPGTSLGKMDKNVENIIRSADLIISKGQGNFETISDCGLNIYFLFLCKCDNFVKIFNVPKNSGMFIKQ